MPLIKKLILTMNYLSILPLVLVKKLSFKSEKFNLIIVDMDGTITTYHTFKEALKKIYLDNGQTYEKVIFTNKELNGLTLDNQRMLKGLEYLINGKYRYQYESELILNAKMKLNQPLVELLKKLSNKIDIIIITRSSDKIAKELAKEVGLTAGYGSVMEYDQNEYLINAKLLVTDGVKKKFENIRFASKEDLASEHMQRVKKEFNLKKTIFFGNDVLDANIMLKSGYSILVKEKNDDFINFLAKFLNIFDFSIRTDSDYIELGKKLLSKIG